MNLQSAFSSLRSAFKEWSTFSTSTHTESFATKDVVQETGKPFGSVLGPLISTNFPDPTIHWNPDDGLTYAFATHNKKPPPHHINIQIAISKDNQTWELQTQDALPKIASWQTGAGVWAPDIKRLPSGKLIMYYSDNVKWAPAHHCVGAATSDNILGPYEPLDKPITCPNPHVLGGAIDPAGFLDPSTGRRYILWKVDGNSLGHGGACGNDIAPIMPTPIMLQEVDSDDGITFIGEAVQILDRDALDGPLIEAPAMHRSSEGIYFLFFSSNCFTTPMYDTSYATATHILGPYTKASRPLFITGDGPDLVGPGGMDIIPDGNMILFHGHMTANNDAAAKEQAEKIAKQTKQAIGNVHLPLIRGMYSGTATFASHLVTLQKT